MQIQTYKTHRITPGESLRGLLDAYVPKLNERSILAVTSKVVSLCEGSVATREETPSKEELIRKQADAYLEERAALPRAVQLTLKQKLLLPSAGVDESNGGGLYVLLPKDSQASAASLWQYLKQRDSLQEFGVIITDSHAIPLRRGMTGIGLGWCGFQALQNYIGQPDCFGSPLQLTMASHLDGLAAAAVFCMGEGGEQTPFASVGDIPRVSFQTSPPSAEDENLLSIPVEEDLYGPLLRKLSWIYTETT